MDYVFTLQSKLTGLGRVFQSVVVSSSEKYKQQTRIIWRLGGLLTEIKMLVELKTE